MTPVFVHEIKLEEKEGNDFAARFNVVSDLYRKSTEEDTNEAWKAFFDAKLCLEQGYPITQ
jgi:hypothetical protein